jgi:hypothetical protein
LSVGQYKLKLIFLIFFGLNTLNFPYISEELTDKYHLRKSILACNCWDCHKNNPFIEFIDNIGEKISFFFSKIQCKWPIVTYFGFQFNWIIKISQLQFFVIFLKINQFFKKMVHCEKSCDGHPDFLVFCKCGQKERSLTSMHYGTM